MKKNVESPQLWPEDKRRGTGFNKQWQRGEWREHFAGAQGFRSHVNLRFGCLITQVLALQMNLNRELSL